MAFRFRKFKVYQDARLIHLDVILLVTKWDSKYFYLIDQVKRSSLSIVLNIAEGSSRQSDKDFNKFIAIALGSVDETIACLEIALDLHIITQQQFSGFEDKLLEISKQLGGLSKFLKTK